MKDARTAMIKMDSSLDDIRAVAIRFSESIKIINEGILSEQNLASLSQGITNFEKSSQSAAALGDDAGPLIAEARVAIKDARQAALEIKAAAQSANSAVQKVSSALDRVPETLASIETTVDKAGDAIDDLNSDEGALSAHVRRRHQRRREKLHPKSS